MTDSNIIRVPQSIIYRCNLILFVISLSLTHILAPYERERIFEQKAQEYKEYRNQCVASRDRATQINAIWQTRAQIVCGLRGVQTILGQARVFREGSSGRG